jgi:hypothetical protein
VAYLGSCVWRILAPSGRVCHFAHGHGLVCACCFSCLVRFTYLGSCSLRAMSHFSCVSHISHFVHWHGLVCACCFSCLVGVTYLVSCSLCAMSHASCVSHILAPANRVSSSRLTFAIDESGVMSLIMSACAGKNSRITL